MEKFDVTGCNATMILDTTKLYLLKTSQIVFYLDYKISNDDQLIKLFNKIKFKYNDITSTIDSKFLLNLLKENTNAQNLNALNKMLSGDIIYLPVDKLFYKNKLFAHNKKIEIEISEIRCTNLEFIYDSDYEIDNTNSQNSEIYVYNVSDYDLKITNIPDDMSKFNNQINISYFDDVCVKKICWIYQNDQNKIIHPMKSIALKGNINGTYYHTNARESNYWIYITQFENCNTIDLNLYVYTPCYFNNLKTNNINFMIINQSIKENFIDTTIKQTVCIQGVLSVS